MEHKSEGLCRFCLKKFSGSAIGRHLLACKKKAEADEKESGKGKKNEIFHIRLSAGKYYWLHIEVPASLTLSQLDYFIREIGVECCGHLSSFTIHGVEYQGTSMGHDFGGFGGIPEPESMEKRLEDVLQVKNQFNYEYDFGSTTYLEGKVLGERQGVLKDGIKILARNNPYYFECSECNEKATDICMECESFICEDCLEDHECGEEMALPAVNSPRMGECGFEGGYYEDKFEESLMEKMTG